MPTTRKPRRALVAEDSALVSFALVRCLRRHQIDIVGPAVSVAGAMILASNADFDIAILDVQLQDGKVYPVAEVLVSRHIPLVFTTGYDDLSAKYFSFPTIAKPFDMTDFIVLVEQAFAIAESSGAAP